jgi:hypothetical protein
MPPTTIKWATLTCCLFLATTVVAAQSNAGVVYISATSNPFKITPNALPEGVATTIQVLLDDSVRSEFERKSDVVSSGAPLGRVLVYITPRPDVTPMRACDDTQNTAQVFGMDYHKSANGVFTIDDAVLGYPMKTLAEALDSFQTQTVYMQAKLTRYDEYKRADGTAPVLPVSCVSPAGGDGMYLEPEGTVFSDVVKVTLRSRTATAQSIRDVGKRLRNNNDNM